MTARGRLVQFGLKLSRKLKEADHTKTRGEMLVRQLGYNSEEKGAKLSKRESSSCAHRGTKGSDKYNRQNQILIIILGQR